MTSLILFVIYLTILNYCFAENDCFLSYPKNEVFTYEFNTQLTVTKTQQNAIDLGIHTGNHDVDMQLKVDIVNHGADDDGLYHFELNIVEGRISNPDNWQHFGVESVDEEEIQNHFMSTMNKPFYFEQSCDLQIEHVHFDSSEDTFAINTKKALVSAFASQFKHDQTSFSNKERDHLGLKTVDYTREALDDESVKVVASHDHDRLVPVDHRALRHTHEKVAHQSRKETTFKNGVVHSIYETTGSRYPADDEQGVVRARTDVSHKVNQGNELVVMSSSVMSATLLGTRELSEERQRDEPKQYDSMSAFFAAGHGDDVEFTRVQRHVVHDEPTTLKDPSQAEVTDFIKKTIELLSIYDNGEFDDMTGNRVHDPTTELLEHWRGSVDSFGDANVVQMICRSLRKTDDCVQDLDNVEKLDEQDVLNDSELFDSPGLPEVGVVAEAASFNAMAMVGSDEAQRAVLARALDTSASWELRNRALMALPLFRNPLPETIATVNAMHSASPIDESGKHVRKQSILTYGALIYNLEVAADAKVVQAELDEAENLSELKQKQQEVKTQCEESRRELHSLFLNAPEYAHVSTGELDVHSYAMALHNSLKDIQLHSWMDPATILHRRGLSLKDFVKEHAEDSSLLDAADSLDNSHYSAVHSLALCHGEDSVCELTEQKAPVDADVLAEIAKEQRRREGIQKLALKTRAFEKNEDPSSPSSRKREPLPVDDGIPISKNSDTVKNLKTKPKNLETFDSPSEERENVRVSERIKDFFETAKCKPWGSCSPYSYRARRPNGEPQEGNRKIWNDTVGSDKFHAYLEALMDFRAEAISSEDVGATYQFFAGSLVAAVIHGTEIPLLQAYAAGSFQHRQRAGEEGGNCTTFELELYFDYLLNAYYLKAAAEKNCTRGIKSTCESNYPPEKEITFHPIDGVEFFKFEYRIFQSWLNALFTIKGVGATGFNLHWGFLISENKGGLALNGLVEPLGKVDLIASVSAPIYSYQGFEVLGISIEGTLNLIQLSLPATGGLNAQTFRGCAALKVVTRALGGKIVLILRVLSLDSTDIELYRWNGAKFELPIFETSCCKECEESCYNAFCNYRFGECECLLGFDGPGCDIECPANCEWPAEPHPGVDCTPGGPRKSSCVCNRGSYGWNCMSECPGGRNSPCNDNGYCDEEGLCTCDVDYYGADCSLTCPVDETGEVCGAHGRCVFDGEVAKCQCFANAVGPKCEMKCPHSLDERQAPCSRRGDCWQDPIDQQPRCLCRLGFHGDICEKLDANGSGRMLEIAESVPEGIEFKKNQTGTEKFDAFASNGASFAGIWFNPSELVDATLVEWRFGVLDLTSSGDVRFCTGKQGECVVSSLKAEVDDWQFISGTVIHYSNEVIVRHWSMKDLSAKKETKQSLAFTDVNMGDNVVAVAKNFLGKVDQLALMHLDSKSGLQNPTFPDSDVLAIRDEVIASHHTALQFYVLFDLGRGDHVFDQVDMLRGELPDRCPLSDDRAPSTCRKERFEFSDVRVKYSTISSPIAPPIKLNGRKQLGVYTVDLGGRRIHDAAMDMVVDAGAAPCSFELFFNNIRIAGTSSPVTGQSNFEMKLDTAGVINLGDGENKLQWEGTAGCTLTESTLSIRVSAVDAAVEFGGSPYSFAVLEHASMPLTGSWQVEMWVRRDPLLLTQKGLLLSMVVPEYAPKDPLDAENSDFLLYETGGSDRGLRIGYRSGPRHLFENYATPINQWFHLALNVRNNADSCTLGFFIDGVDLAASHPNKASKCGNGAIKGFGTPQMELRLGMGFGGEVNDLLFFKAPRNGIRANMHLVKDIDALKSSLLAAYTFDTLDEVNPAVIIDDIGAQNNGQLQNGAFRSLIYGVYHNWKLCPGVTHFSTETVCSTRTYWEQGVCVRRPGVDNFACECNHGFFGTDCSGECPGGAGNICSNHGKCLVTNATQCVCDLGYVGPACEFECPGWTHPLNLPNQKVCFGFGKCQLRETGVGAECICDQDHDRYGAMCQYTYGEDPQESIDEECEDCRGAHKTCVDGLCVCEDDYLLVVGVCKRNAATLLSVSLSVLLAALVKQLF